MKTSSLFIILLVIALVCSGCASADQPDSGMPNAPYEYIEVYQRISEPYGSGFVLHGNVMQAAINEHIYAFSSSITEELRADFINAQEKLCLLLSEHGVSTNGITFRILVDYTNWTDSESFVAYYGIESLCSWAQVLTTVQAAMGDYTNYGYLYALANHVAAELGWAQDDFADAAMEISEVDISLLNLVYPCFDEAYTDAESIAVCKAVAKEILSELDDVWSEEAFLQARVDYAQKENLDFQPTYMTFAFYSQSCPLKLRTRYLEIYKDYTYEQDFYCTVGYITEDYWASTSKIIQTFHWLDENLEALRDTFQIGREELVPVQLKSSVKEQENFAASGVCVYDEDSCYIQAKTIHCLAHEYVHYLFWLSGGTTDPAFEKWINEVVAHYYTLAADFEVYLLIGQTVDPGRIAAIEELINEEYDEPSDYVTLTRKTIRNRENVQYPYYLKTEYILCAAFGEYFSRTYGEVAFFNCMLTPSKVQTLTGKTMDEIVDDWCLDMEIPEND